MTAQQVASGWSEGASDAMDTAEKLMIVGKYHHALFFCHLTLEKQLKAKYTEVTNEPPLPVHNLLRLAELSGIALSVDQKEQMREINTFNIEARYDDYKLRFYKKATKEFAQKWFTITQELFLWLKNN
jgi:HEPN domain-containing protein